MTKTNKLKIATLALLTSFSVAFPAAVALANRPTPAPASFEAPHGDVQLGPVTVVDEYAGTWTPVVETLHAVATRHPRPVVAAHGTSCRRIDLEQQGRPGARSVVMCENVR